MTGYPEPEPGELERIEAEDRSKLWEPLVVREAHPVDEPVPSLASVLAVVALIASVISLLEVF